MEPQRPPEPRRLADSIFAQPSSPDVRVQRCLEAIRRALEEHDCELVVSVQFTNGGAAPHITIVPAAAPPERPK
jgi:hypothetical protein